jgi:hypothetical protein
MAAAKYSIHVPAYDEHGNPLRVHQAVHQHLLNLGHEAPTIQEGRPYHHVVSWAEESPEMDSQMKQIGAYTGETCNVPVVHVTKEGKNTARWPMRNLSYAPGWPAEQSAFANEPNIGEIGLQTPDTGVRIPLGTPMPPEIPTNPLMTAST